MVGVKVKEDMNAGGCEKDWFLDQGSGFEFGANSSPFENQLRCCSAELVSVPKVFKLAR